jgi:hypothetical protein
MVTVVTMILGAAGGIKSIVTIDTTVTGRLSSRLPPRRAHCAFDTECQKCFCVTFEKSNKTPAYAVLTHGKEVIYMERTISVMLGKGSVRHNTREFKATNVDAERTQYNIEYCN